MSQKLNKIKQFLKELQRSDERRKKRWLIVGSTFSMIVVLGLWFVYISTSLPSLVPPQNTSQKKSFSEIESTWQIFKIGLNEIFQEIKDQLKISKKIIEEQLQKTNELIITPPSPPLSISPEIVTTTPGFDIMATTSNTTSSINNHQ